MFANCQLMGLNLSFPDICWTPPVPPPRGIPLPYPNVSLNPMATGFCAKVLWVGMPAHTLKTKVPISFGDEPGIGLGIISNMIKGPTSWLPVLCAFTVLLEKAPATRMGTMTLQNRNNMIGFTIVPSQCKVLILSA